MLYAVNGSGVKGAVLATLNEMPDQDQFADHFTSSDRKLLIENSVLTGLTRQEVAGLKSEVTTRVETIRTETLGIIERQRQEDRQADGKLEGRVRTLENFRWWLLGAVAFASPLLSALTSWFFSKGHL